MGRKYKYHCVDCGYCCPFTDDDGNGNCVIDLKDINVFTDRCNKFNKDPYISIKNDK